MASSIHPTAIIYPGVQLGQNVDVGAFCIIGERSTVNQDEKKTIIGDDSVIRSHTIIYAGNTIGRGFNTGHHVLVREDNQIGENVSIGSLSCVEHHVFIGEGVRIHSSAFIPEYSQLKNSCWIGPGVVLTNARYPKSMGVKETLEGVVINEHAMVGANATILPGRQIGSWSLVGSGSVVTHDVHEGDIVVGNPATPISTTDSKGIYQK